MSVPILCKSAQQGYETWQLKTMLPIAPLLRSAVPDSMSINAFQGRELTVPFGAGVAKAAAGVPASQDQSMPVYGSAQG